AASRDFASMANLRSTPVARARATKSTSQRWRMAGWWSIAATCSSATDTTSFCPDAPRTWATAGRRSGEGDPGTTGASFGSARAPVDLSGRRGRAAAAVRNFGVTLDELNALSRDVAERELAKCCGSTRWASAMAARRPFRNLDQLHRAAHEIWGSLDGADWLE